MLTISLRPLLLIMGLVRLNGSLLLKWPSNRLASAGLSCGQPEYLNLNIALHNVLIPLKEVELSSGLKYENEGGE
jgi:hypothetical protein